MSSAIASLPTTNPADAKMPESCRDRQCRRQVELNVLKNECAYWKIMHQRATEREERLTEENEHLQGRIRYLEQQLYGRKSEKNSGGSEKQDTPKDQNKCPRGQQKGAKGHGRRNHDHLPKEEVFVGLPEDEQICPCCGLPFDELAFTEDSEEKVIEVRAHRRVYKRKRYTPTCRCACNPAIITAPVPAKLFPKGGCDTSIWVEIILWKFLFQVPTNRLLAYWEQSCDLALPPGTVGDNLKRLPPLFAPLEKVIFQRCRDSGHWHADETRWFVFSDEVANQRWYLWVFRSPDAVVYILDPTRSSIVPKSFFGAKARGIIKELSNEKLHLAKRKILESLENHWSGLVLFVKQPFIPMSNAEAERKLRNPVNGRKDYHGSGSIWSGFLMATLLTVLQTIVDWGLNPHLWLTAYLEVCAKAGGVAPPDFEKFLPWNMSVEMRDALIKPRNGNESPTAKERDPPR